MRTIIKEVGKLPQVTEIENTLMALQSLVGGYIEAVGLEDGVLLICNEEGKLQGLPPNFAMGLDVIVGTAVFVSHNGKGDFTALSDEQIDYVLSKFE